jgi:hypothetical protein
MTQSLREKYIDIILKNKYGDQKHDSANRTFLQTLTLNELVNLADYQEEMEFELEEEISDVDDMELY